MIYKLKTSYRYCKTLGFDWEMVDSIVEVPIDEQNDIRSRMVEHKDNSGLTWDQLEILPDGKELLRNTFISIPDKILALRDTPLKQTVYIEIEEIPDLLMEAIRLGRTRYEI